MQGIPENLRTRLLKLLHARTDSDADTDELNSILLQVSLALMLIFMIAFFLFMTKVEGEITQIDVLKQKVADAEQTAVLRAVEQVVERYRIAYGLKEFMVVDPISGEKSFEFSGVIENGKLEKSGPAQNTFVSGSAAAKRDYDDPAALEQQWIELVNTIAGESAAKNPKLVRELVRDNILRVRGEVMEVQTLAAAAMQEYFAQHPNQVRDEAIRALLVRINQTPDSPDRAARIKELSVRLNKYVYDHLAGQCGVKMLEEERPNE